MTKIDLKQLSDDVILSDLRNFINTDYRVISVFFWNR